MKRVVFLALLWGCSIFLYGCDSQKKTEQRLAAEALHAASEKCVKSVSDSRLKYEESSSCIALGELAGVFLRAGGLADDADQKSFLKFEQARLNAWIALALSEGRGKSLRIW